MRHEGGGKGEREGEEQSNGVQQGAVARARRDNATGVPGNATYAMKF